MSVRKFTATPNTGDSRGILPHSVMYGAIQMLVRYERFGEILHEDCVFMDAVQGFHAPVRQGASIFVRRNTKKYLQKPLIRSLNGIYWRYSEFSDRHYLVSVRKFTATPNTGDFRGILPHSVMYGAIQMLVRYERFGEILHEDCVFMDAVRRFHAPIR